MPLARRGAPDRPCILMAAAIGYLTAASIGRGLNLSFQEWERFPALDSEQTSMPRNHFTLSRRMNSTIGMLEFQNRSTALDDDLVITKNESVNLKALRQQREGLELQHERWIRQHAEVSAQKGNILRKDKPTASQNEGDNLSFFLPFFRKTETKKKGKAIRKSSIKYRRKAPRVIHFVHIHKSGGSLFCHLAFKNKFNSNQKNNCNVQPDQRCCGDEDSIAAQIKFANLTKYDMVATEREMYDSMAPAHFDYVVTLREAKTRYYSHWSHLRRIIPIGPAKQTSGFGTSAWLFGDNEPDGDEIKSRDLKDGEDPLGTFTEWIQRQPDNWSTRIICGPKCRRQPKFQLTDELFNYTLHRADKFAHFLFVEDMEASYNRFAASYNWTLWSKIVTPRFVEQNGNTRKDKNHSSHLAVNEAWDPMMSALDDALYEFAKRKFRGEKEHLWDPFHNQAIIDRYFTEGPKVGCKDGCCGKCSQY